MAEKLSLDRIDEIMRAVFLQLKAMGGRARGRDVLAAIEPKLGLTEYEKEKLILVLSDGIRTSDFIRRTA